MEWGDHLVVLIGELWVHIRLGRGCMQRLARGMLPQDELKPCGRILRKRLSECAAQPCRGEPALRHGVVLALCKASPEYLKHAYLNAQLVSGVLATWFSLLGLMEQRQDR